MKKFFQLIGLLSLITITFFYTDKVMHVIREEDKIMIEIKEIKDKLKVDAINAQVENDTIIPGINGKKVNIEKSYKSMKLNGVFRKEDIIYDKIYPKISITNNKDKYIISGNLKKQAISLLFIINNNNYNNKLENIIKNKNITVNYFVDYNYLISNSTKIKNITNSEFYSYGNNGTYTPDNIIFSNNLISRISKNKSNLCLTKEKNKKTIEICSKNELYTILPTIIVEKKPYIKIKNTITPGNIILLPINQETINELPIIIDYIKGKGIKIIGLKELISEE